MTLIYSGVNWDIVWYTVKNSLPVLKENIQKILDELNEKGR